MSNMTPQPGDVITARVRPGNLNGRRSRAGLLFTDDADTSFVVGDDPNQISVDRAKAIAGDNGLVVKIDRPGPEAKAPVAKETK